MLLVPPSRRARVCWSRR